MMRRCCVTGDERQRNEMSRENVTCPFVINHRLIQYAYKCTLVQLYCTGLTYEVYVVVCMVYSSASYAWYIGKRLSL